MPNHPFKRPGKARRTQVERSKSTIALLVEAARQQFAAKGYAETSIDNVLEAAGVTRGALYHHFATKSELFRAVFEEQEKIMTKAIAVAAGPKKNAWAAFRAGCEGFLDACLDPATQRIVLIDAPSVLGWDTMREVESRYALAMLRGGLKRAMEEGHLASRPVETLSQLLLGALSECAMSIARSPDPMQATRDARRELDHLLKALS
jgi:AcrR family transcriptional regulator